MRRKEELKDEQDNSNKVYDNASEAYDSVSSLNDD